MMRLGHKIPVEPLDEQRYQRVEDAIVAAMPGSSPASAAAPGRTPGQRWFARLGGARWLVPAVVAAGVALALYAGLGGLDAGDPGQPLPTRIATGDGSSTFGLGDAVCTAAPHSDLTLDLSGDSAGRANIAWQLERGEITCEVEPRPERAAVVVRAGAVTVTVVGTVFTVGRGSGDSREVYVAVSRGQVRVDTAGRSFEVGTGQRWTESTMEVTSSDAEWAAAVGDRAAATRGPEAGAEAGADSDVDTDADSDVDTDSDADADADVDSDADVDVGGRVEVGAVGRSGPAGLRSRDSRVPRVAGGARRGDRAGESRSKGRPIGTAAQRRALARAGLDRGTPPVGPDAAGLPEIIELETKKPKIAVIRYRKRALQRGPAAEFAMYRMAYVQYVRLRDGRAALKTLDHYQRRFARGAHRESALWLRIRILCGGDDRSACRAAAHTYLNRFPGGRHAALAGQIVNWDI